MMMSASGQPFQPHPGAMQQHPGMVQGQMMHNAGQPGMGMPQQIHMGVSGPGPQGNPQVMMAGMPPGAGPSAHALQHLNPGQLNPSQQQQMMMQQQHPAMYAGNPNPQFQQHMQQQQMLQQQRAAQIHRQTLIANQYGGGMPGMAARMPNQMTPGQFQSLRAPAAVSLPQHLQQQQVQAEHTLQQQQQQQHAHNQHQLMLAQQMAMQSNQGQPGNNQQSQPNQMNAQQHQQAQVMMQQQQQQQQANQHQQAQAAAASQQSQGQPQSQSQPQQPQTNAQAQAQAQQSQNQQQQSGMTPAHAQAMRAALQQQQGATKMKGQCILTLSQFCASLGDFGVSKQRDDLSFWFNFVERFFSPKGVLRHSLWLVDENSSKQFEITYPALPRYFYTYFESGVKSMQLVVEKTMEKELPNNTHYVESQKSSFVYWFDNGSHLIANGTLKAHFDADQKIELLEFITSSHEEFVSRSRMMEAARPLHEWQKEWTKINSPPDGKPSPEMNKKSKAKQMKSPPQPPPDIGIPESKLNPNIGITRSVFRFLELTEVMVQMNPLFLYSHQNASLAPYSALDQYVANIPANSANGQSGPRTPGMNNFPVGASPAQAHLNLPDGSPHMGSPAQGVNMQLQQSQHGTSSSGPSANTSPNQNNLKRRRPSTVKAEDEVQINGIGQQGNKTTVKPSPRLGGKRQKGNPA